MVLQCKREADLYTTLPLAFDIRHSDAIFILSKCNLRPWSKMHLTNEKCICIIPKYTCSKLCAAKLNFCDRIGLPVNRIYSLSFTAETTPAQLGMQVHCIGGQRGGCHHSVVGFSHRCLASVLFTGASITWNKVFKETFSSSILHYSLQKLLSHNCFFGSTTKTFWHWTKIPQFTAVPPTPQNTGTVSKFTL